MNVRPGTETLRFPRPASDASKKKDPPKPMPRHDGLLQDQTRRAQRPPWCPSFSMAVRILLLIRVSGAMYSNISDCDEVYNFWEPLHYLDRGYGFQTWETSPQYAIRSWAYVALHLYPATALTWLLGLDKRASFFALRIFFGFVSSLCEAKLYRTVMETINFRVGRYMLFMLMFSAGMWNASTAFLPSSFAMFSNILAFSYSLHPPSVSNSRRTLYSTVLFGMGAIVGWPFALAIAIPFVFEELFVYGADRVPSEKRTAWFLARVVRLFTAGACAALLFIPVIGIDSLAYGHLTIVPWNIVKYNVLGGSSRGPDLYGTEPWHFYIQNLLLNFNVLTPLALLALPALAITYFVDNKRVGGPLRSTSSAEKEKDKALGSRSSPFTLLAIRLAPFYVWFGIFTLQAHKEERFFFPAYPFLAFNAAVALYLVRGWLEAAYVKATRSPYKASRTSWFQITTLAVVFFASVISVARILALSYYFHAPLEVAHHFESHELVRVLNVTGLLAAPPPPPPTLLKRGKNKQNELDRQRIDLSPIKSLNLTLCYGKEWYRFPGHFLVPDGVNVEFVKSEFDGMLPRHFVQSNVSENTSGGVSGLWKRSGTRYVPEDLNDLNEEDPRHYVDIKSCHYLIDLDSPNHPSSSPHEPRYAIDDEHWQRMYCAPFLDSAHSPLLTRAIWLPGKWWQTLNSYGDYCLLKRKDIF
ncbi:asparagine-linked glycosylation 9 protein isoform a [Fomitiporia mediterranea MF3/22]|uniref:asparagine-linked glycosylation 9 protein isoform a n=1 Tax=Fomitiporia mediterranea (strain MF3/22) TaxID=694068 RepID=UPI0004409201|nr:asparagine-linked glycosylation 9 protein isoform a [Fomitiporia mediterranea MF3/22]EJC98743.1 asparagine-linked glycosylation 9 protein isoform a [Fomitiporia mediterranea MF3/22]